MNVYDDCDWEDLFDTPDPRMLVCEDPSYDGEGVCIEQYLDIAFDDVPY